MKKFLCFVILAILMFQAVAFAEGDYSSYTTEELIDMKDAIVAELATRTDAGPVHYTEGQYVVGRDIPAGKYKLTLLPTDSGNTYTNWYIYESKSMYDYDVSRLFLGDLPKAEDTLREGKEATISLYNGDYFVLYRSGAEVEYLGSVVDYEIDYEVPEGTKIPVGLYTFGDEIPAGTYNVYYNGNATARIGTYPDADSAKNDFITADSELILNEDNTNGLLHGEEGDVLYVEYNYVIMTKSAGFSFD